MVNVDEEKRRLQYMQLQTEQKLSENQNMQYESKPKVRDLKKLLTTIGVVAGILLLLILLSQGGIL